MPAVCLEDGTLASSGQEASNRWVRHFAANEGGQRATLEEAVQQFAVRPRQAEAFDIELGEVPSRLDVEKAMLNVVCGKAAGPDSLPPELVRYGSGPLSVALYSLFLKFSLRLDEVLLWKGGTLCRAWKGKQAPDKCSSYRALLVSSTCGKVVHSALRSCFLEPMRRASPPFQVGGLPRFPVTFASHMLRLFMSWQRGRSFFVLFLDLREAFYRVARHLISSPTPSHEEVAWAFRHLDLPPDSFRDF